MGLWGRPALPCLPPQDPDGVQALAGVGGPGGGRALSFFLCLFSSVRDNLPFSNRPGAWTVIISILWIRKLRHREARTCPRLCTGEGWDSSPRAKEFLGLHSSGCMGEGQRWDSNPGEELLGLHAHPCVVSPHPGP